MLILLAPGTLPGPKWINAGPGGKHYRALWSVLYTMIDGLSEELEGGSCQLLMKGSCKAQQEQ